MEGLFFLTTTDQISNPILKLLFSAENRPPNPASRRVVTNAKLSLLTQDLPRYLRGRARLRVRRDEFGSFFDPGDRIECYI